MINDAVETRFSGRSTAAADRGATTRSVAIATLAVIALAYYGAFYNYTFNIGDEGSVALISERLANGETPYRDIEIGYGILWYLPIVGLFKVLGAKLYLVKIYFATLGFLSALAAYAVLLRIGAPPAFAFTVALVVLLFPGVNYQTYIPLLALAGLYVVLMYEIKTLKPVTARWLALTVNGLFIATAFLIRPDLATAFTILIVGYHALIALRQALAGHAVNAALRDFAARLLAIGGVATLATLPFVVQANSDGYLHDFLRQYSAYGERLITLSSDRLSAGALTNSTAALPLLARLPPQAFFWPNYPKGFIFLTYAPFLLILPVLAYVATDFVRQLRSTSAVSDFLRDRTHLLVITGAALSTFPQFFVWRPDLPHLYGFVPGFAVLTAYVIFLLSRSRDRGFLELSRRVGTYTVCAFAAIYLVVFAQNFEGLNLRDGRHYQLRLPKGVDVYLNKPEFQTLSQLHSLLTEATAPGEFVLCFPYCPGVNFIANRPTFQKFLYVDDAILRDWPSWFDDTNAQIASKRPKAIVIHDWPVNGTDFSRFRNWARPVYEYVAEHYELRFKVNSFEVFVLKEQGVGAGPLATSGKS